MSGSWPAEWKGAWKPISPSSALQKSRQDYVKQKVFKHKPYGKAVLALRLAVGPGGKKAALLDASDLRVETRAPSDTACRLPQMF